MPPARTHILEDVMGTKDEEAFMALIRPSLTLVLDLDERLASQDTELE